LGVYAKEKKVEISSGFPYLGKKYWKLFQKQFQNTLMKMMLRQKGCKRILINGIGVRSFFVGYQGIYLCRANKGIGLETIKFFEK